MTKEETRALRCLFRRLGGFDGKMKFDCGSDTDLIQEKTQLWRDTWILPVLGALVAKGEGRATFDDKQTIVNAAKDGW